MRQFRSELLKVRTTLTVPVLLLAAAAIALIGVSAEVLSRDPTELAAEATQRELLSAGVTIGVFFATLSGLLAVTSEFRYGTIRPTLLVEPRRRVVLAAKLAAAAVVGVLFGAVCVAVSFAAGLTIRAARDVGVALSTSHVTTLVIGPLLASLLSGMLGVAIGSLIRNQVGAIVALAAYALVVDAMLFAAAPSLGRFLPGKAGDALAGRPVEHLLSPEFGILVLAAWSVALIAVAAVRNDRVDV